MLVDSGVVTPPVRRILHPIADIKNTLTTVPLDSRMPVRASTRKSGGERLLKYARRRLGRSGVLNDRQAVVGVPRSFLLRAESTLVYQRHARRLVRRTRRRGRRWRWHRDTRGAGLA